jgi:hypothetical protein
MGLFHRELRLDFRGEIFCALADLDEEPVNLTRHANTAFDGGLHDGP